MTITQDLNWCCMCIKNSWVLFIGGGIQVLQQDTIIDFVTIASTGDATDFGNLTQARMEPVRFKSNSWNICWSGANRGSSTLDTIEYITIASDRNSRTRFW